MNPSIIRGFISRSATYYSGFGLCKLSEETRRSAPASFRPAQRGTTYLENECAVCKSFRVFYFPDYKIGTTVNQ